MVGYLSHDWHTDEWEISQYDSFMNGYVLYRFVLADSSDESKFRENAKIKFTGDKVEGYDLYTNVKIISVE